MEPSPDQKTGSSDEPVLDEEIRAELEERLLEKREELQEDLRNALEDADEPPAESAGDLSKLPSHPADAASAADEADTDFRVAERSSERLDVVIHALDRLREEPGEYGICEVCGEVIELERLRLVPWTRRCADHAPEAPAST